MNEIVTPLRNYRSGIRGLRASWAGIALALVGGYLPWMAHLDTTLHYHGTIDFVMVIVVSFLLLFLGKISCLQLPITKKALGVSMGLDVSVAALLSSMHSMGALLLPVSLGFYLGYLLQLARISGQKKNVRSVKRTIAIGLASLVFLVIGILSEGLSYSSTAGPNVFFLSASVWALLGFLFSFLMTLSDLLRWLKEQGSRVHPALTDGPSSL
jgi:hypothetical protein